MVFGDHPPGDHGERVNVYHFGWGNEGSNKSPDRMEAVVEGFEYDRGVGRVQFRHVEEYVSL
jgi:hypothetical protein